MTTRDPLFKSFSVDTQSFPIGLDVAGVIVRELQVRDDLEIGIRCDTLVPAAARNSITSLIQAQKREGVRLSIVAVQDEPGGDWHRVNDPNPFIEMDEWAQKTYTAVLKAHYELNGASEDDGFLEKATFKSQAEILAMIGQSRGGPTHQDARSTERPPGR